MNIICFALAYHFQLFPAYVELEKRTTARFAASAALGISTCCTTYATMGIICLFLFGKEINSDLLISISGQPGIASILIRSVFCLLLLIHVPYIFMPTKEFILVIHDEIARRSLSDHLERKIQAADLLQKQKREAKELEEEEEGDALMDIDGKQEDLETVSVAESSASTKSQLAYKQLSD